MLIKLTDAHDKAEFHLRADFVIMARRASDNPLVTLVTTTMMGQKGAVVYAVLENPDEVAEMVNSAYGSTHKLQMN